VHPNAKAFGYGEHAGSQMGASKCEGIRLRGTCAQKEEKQTPKDEQLEILRNDTFFFQKLL
jgi:hypothetical protein